MVPEPLEAVDTVSLDRALETVETLDPDFARLVELHLFAGLTNEETALAQGVSVATIKTRLDDGQRVAAPRVKRRQFPTAVAVRPAGGPA